MYALADDMSIISVGGAYHKLGYGLPGSGLPAMTFIDFISVRMDRKAYPTTLGTTFSNSPPALLSSWVQGHTKHTSGASSSKLLQLHIQLLDSSLVTRLWVSPKRLYLKLFNYFITSAIIPLGSRAGTWRPVSSLCSIS
jgi:hypothetical protein